jgi:hypothetical protein
MVELDAEAMAREMAELCRDRLEKQSESPSRLPDSQSDLPELVRSLFALSLASAAASLKKGIW